MPTAKFMIQLELHQHVKPSFIELYLSVRVEIINCYYNAYSYFDIQAMHAHGSSTNPTTVVIKNTTFLHYTHNRFRYLAHSDSEVSFFYYQISHF